MQRKFVRAAALGAALLATVVVAGVAGLWVGQTGLIKLPAAWAR